MGGKKITTEEFIKRANVIHKNKYDYSYTVYTKSKDKVKILCNNHGIFEQRADNHLSGDGCFLCGIVTGKFKQSLSTEEFIKRANVIHKNKYGYDQVYYINSYTKVKILCNAHSIFEQTPNSHLEGHGCPSCSITSFNNGYTKEGFSKIANGKKCTFYIIKCFNDQEEFYKIGITTQSVKYRFSGNNMPYNYTIIKEINCDAETVWNLENSLKENLNLHYVPLIPFAGSSNECFTDLKEIENKLNEVLLK